MAFPTIAAGTTTLNSGGNATTHLIAYPASVATGDLLLCFVGNDGAGDTVTLSNFTQLVTARASAAADNGAGTWFYRVATGAHSGNETITVTTTEWVVATMLRIPAASWHGTAATGLEGTGFANTAASNANPNPPSETASWGADDNLWIASAAWDDAPTYVSSPASYTALIDVDPAAAGCFGIAVAYRNLNTATEDPGTFAISASEQWAGFTVVVRPAAAGGGAVTVTPTAGTLVLSGIAPSVSVSDHKVVSPAAASLVLAGVAPTVSISDHKVVSPAAASLVLTGVAPTVSVSSGSSVTVTPAAASLVLAGVAPTVSVTAHKVVSPAPAALTLSGVAPTVAVSDHKLITPTPASLVLTAFAPNVVISDHKVVTPSLGQLFLAGVAPTVAVGAAVSGGLAPRAGGYRPGIVASAASVVPGASGAASVPDGSGSGPVPRGS